MARDSNPAAEQSIHRECLLNLDERSLPGSARQWSPVSAGHATSRWCGPRGLGTAHGGLSDWSWTPWIIRGLATGTAGS